MRFFCLFFTFLAFSLSEMLVLAQPANPVNKVFEYKPAPGQFVNSTIGQPQAVKNLIGSSQGLVTLGAFGGYITVGFELPVENDPNNPYGVDFTIFGNATDHSSEPAAVYVMNDQNNNGLPDDTWYLLAGSDYWFSSTIKNYEITWKNPGTETATDVPWSDNQGNSGVLPANEFHTQSYYPNTDSFPDIGESEYMLSGVKVNVTLDKSDPAFVKVARHAFGFADNTKMQVNAENWLPDNPYTRPVEGRGGDAFDISWAVDSQGNAVDLDQIHFIKIQTAANALAGWLGEISAEVSGIVDVEPDNTLAGEQRMIVIEPVNLIREGEEISLNAFYFESGKPANELISWESSEANIAEVSTGGLLLAKNQGECHVYARLSSDNSIYDSISIQVKAPLNILSRPGNQVNVFPVPVDAVLHVQASENYLTYSIFDVSGKQVKTGKCSANIDVSSLEPGCYQLLFKGRTVHEVKQIIVE